MKCRKLARARLIIFSSHRFDEGIVDGLFGLFVPKEVQFL